MNSTQTNRSAASGMTLLEVMIAASSASVVLVGLWGMLGTFAQLYEKGLEQTQTQRVASALQCQLIEDLHHTISLITQHSESRSTQSAEILPGTSSAAKHADTAQSRSTRDDNEQPKALAPLTNGPVALMGTRTSLVLDVLTTLEPYSDNSKGAASSHESNENGTQFGQELDVTDRDKSILGADLRAEEAQRRPGSRIPELRRVIYQFQAPTHGRLSFGLERRQLDWEQAHGSDPGLGTAADVSIGTANNSVASPIFNGLPDPRMVASTDSSPRSLIRQDSDRSLLDKNPNSGEFGYDSKFGYDNVDRIPEVIRFELRYFDGLAWHDSWNSREHGNLPVAVDVALDIELSRDHRQIASTNGLPDSESPGLLSKMDEPTATSTRTSAVRSSSAAGSMHVEFDRPPTEGLTYWRPQYRFLVYLRPAHVGDVWAETSGEDAR